MTFFEITHKDKKTQARTGVIHTDHGNIETPVFMPVGTQATVKTLDKQDLENIDASIILANTYHLHLRPGEDLIDEFGGLHKFMNWDRPILTDSGGFQVFSLGLQKEEKGQGSLTKIDDDGVTFKSHLDGSTHRFTPENAIEIQHKIGADIIMAFDECTPDNADEAYTRRALDRTHSWATRCITEHRRQKKIRKSGLSGNPDIKLFGIIQGAGHKKLRQESAQAISGMDFDGIAIGGESIGYNMKATKKILDWVNPIIPENKPHYTMGVGYSPTDLFDVVERGVDMFDCVAPTRVARNGRLFVHKKVNKKLYINILNAENRENKKSIDPDCTCFTCQNHSRAYLHHLFKTQELLAYRLATIHNLHFMISLMKEIRESITEDRFTKLKKEWTK
ncbi:tRNA guanosine(34) transglycosylase Tgt [Candidatus Parcubacteria bacterium]|nr:MAG: tRNA guanosine(34) transglycosylase Tgt [Candidatus Parcubacteria bacterium]